MQGKLFFLAAVAASISSAAAADDIRRVVTGLDDKNHAVVLFDSRVPLKSDSPVISSTNFWITDSTPPTIVRGRLRAGFRSSSMKYKGLCQPPYVMTIACKAITNPLNVIDEGMRADRCPSVGTRRQAATRTKNATHFSEVVTS